MQQISSIRDSSQLMKFSVHSIYRALFEAKERK